MLGLFTSAFVPIIKQMELFNSLHKSKAKDIPVRELRKLSQDSFQLFCVGLSATNQRRRELLKQDLDPKFHKICEKAYPMSATDLFGDKLDSDPKELDAPKKIRLKKPSKGTFTEKKNFGHREVKQNRQFYRDQNFHRGSAHSHKPFHRRGKKYQKPRLETNKRDKQ